MTLRVLILDDEPERHDALLRIWGQDAEVTQAWTATEAIRSLSTAGPFDLAMLDHDLGPASRGDGLRVARHLAAMSENRRPPRVLVHSDNTVKAPVMVDSLRRAGIETSWVRIQQSPLRLVVRTA